MRVVQFSEYGGPEVLEVADVPLPELVPGAVRIKICATAINPADWKWRQGMFDSFAPVPFPHVPGYDVAGTVDAIGADVTGFAIGDRVFAMLNHFFKGGYAEYALVTATDLVHMPDELDFATAAALPTAALTGVQLVEEHARISPQSTVLITGATGGVGRFAMFAARGIGAHIVAAVRSSHADEARALGASETVALGRAEWSGKPFDCVIDTVGGADVARLCRHLAPGGQILTVSTTPIDKEGLACEPVFIAVHNDAARLQRLARSVAVGEITVPIAKRLPLTEAAEGQRLGEQGGIGGKIILEP